MKNLGFALLLGLGLSAGIWGGPARAQQDCTIMGTAIKAACMCEVDFKNGAVRNARVCQNGVWTAVPAGMCNSLPNCYQCDYGNPSRCQPRQGPSAPTPAAPAAKPKTAGP